MPEVSRFEALARAALHEITPDAPVSSYAGETDEGDGVTSVLFDSAMPGYPGWKWTVSVAQVEGEEPTVLEAELMPADGALLAPDWVPWSERLAEYKAAQESAGETGIESDDADDESDDEDEDDEEDEDDDDEDDVLGNEVLHGGDLDGVDIDDIDGDIVIDDEDDLDDDDPADDDDLDDELDEDGEPDEGYIR
ncbi:hypothetical protein BH10ACT7_BH10ACT7_04400 [soil metagenome]